MRAARFAKDTIIILGTKIGILAVSVVYSILLARILGPEGKGAYSLVLLFSSLFVTFLNFGLGPATVYFTAKGAYSRETILKNSYLAVLLLGCSGIILGILLLELTGPKLYPDIPRHLLYITLLLIPINLFNNQLATQYLLGANKIDLFNITSFAAVLLPLVSFLLAVVLIGPDMTAVLWSRVIALSILAVLLLFWFRHSYGRISFGLDKDYIKEVYQYGIRAYLGNVIGFLNYRVEVFLLGYFLPLAAVGYYSVAVSLAESLWLVSQSAGTLIFPMVSAEEDDQKNKYVTPLVARTVLGITLLGAVGLFFLVDWFIPLFYANQYNPSIPLFKILLPGVVFISGSRVLANDIAGRGKPILNTYIGGAGFVLQVLANLILIPQLGAVGAAWASSTAYLVLFIIRLFVYIRISGNHWKAVILPQQRDWDLYRLLWERSWNYLAERFLGRSQ